MYRSVTYSTCAAFSTANVGQINYSFDKASGKAVLKPEYQLTQTEYKILIDRCRVKLTEYKNKLLLCKSDYEKELLIHDELCKNVVYADEGERSHSMIGPLLYGIRFMQSFSKRS